MTGDVGVCIATSGPGATNLVTGLADALLDSVPMVAITGQVPRKMIGTDAFQETPIVEVTRQITKHNYLVMDIQVGLQQCAALCLYEHRYVNIHRTPMKSWEQNGSMCIHDQGSLFWASGCLKSIVTREMETLS